MAASTIDAIIHLISVAIIAVIGLFAYRSGISKTQATSQDNTIRALQGEINVLKDRISEVEKENHRHTQTISLIKSALSQRGTIITIDGDLVTISDTKGSSQSAHQGGESRVSKGLVVISLIAVRDMLRLPEEYEFIEAAYNGQNNTLEILVEHPDIPAPGPDTRHIEVRPVFRQRRNVLSSSKRYR